MTAIQDGDFLIAGGAASSADTFISSGGATLEPGAENLTITGGSADDAGLLPGEFELTGYALEAVPLPVQTLEAGEFLLTGEPVEALGSFLLEAETASAALTGEEIQFVKYTRTLDCETRVLFFEGYGLESKIVRAASATSGSYTLTGYDATIATQRSYALFTGAYAFTGRDVELRKDNKIVPVSGSFTLSGSDLAFLADTSLRPVSGSYSLTGFAADFSRGVSGFTLDAGSFEWTGYDINANLQKRDIALEAGTLAFTGGVLNFSLSLGTVFGSYRPTTRRFNPGSHFYSVAQTISGTETRRIWGNKSNDASLELEYENILESVALDILRMYEAAYGSYASFVLPNDTFAGASEQLRDKYRLSGTSMKWYFAEPPRVRSVRPGVCTLSLKFNGKTSYQR